MRTSADECGLYYCFSIKKYLRSSCLNLRPSRSFYHFDTSPPNGVRGLKGALKEVYYISSVIEVYIHPPLKYIFVRG